MKDTKKFKKRYFVIILIAIYSLLQVVVLQKENNTAYKFKAKNGFPLIISHGGSKLLFPENTVLAFEETMKLGVDVLELDLRLTKDNILVTHHNETIDETSDGTGKVNDYTYQQLQQFNFGAKFKALDKTMPYTQKNEKVVPMKLDDLFAKYAGKVLFIIEIKDEGELGRRAAEQIKDLLQKYNIYEDVNVASFDVENNRYYTQIKNTNSHTSGSENQVKSMVYSMYSGVDFLFKYGVEGVQLPTYQSVPLDTDYLIYKMHKHNLFVHYWTINDENTMRSLIHKKVDGIITDRPDLLLKLKQEYTKK